ncbi:GumC family protein [Lutibaculum baratangense]|uniref:Polysaccharide chain length determinant N-terminal domain-containing protein n=1 Tax=Lutibaculum baratangense AMV1 TaxID=631454 RepID=V4T9W6_9HYPH|nr:hypothetical protein [Lutibaculum baratangense]ESR23288.1 hypothetical protein N177_3356 [Lutibaculum baratangense AMV1]
MRAPINTQPTRDEELAAGLTAAGLLASVWRRRACVIVPLVVVLALTIGWLALQTPLYRSSAKLLVENQETVYTRPQNVTSSERSILDQEAIRSQVQLILAGDLSRTVIRRLNLAQNPEFAPSGGPIRAIMRSVGLGSEREAAEDQLLEAFYDRLTVYQIDQSRVIAIEFSAANPLLAAQVANAVAEEYLEMQRAAKRDTTREASLWLDAQIEQLRQRVGDAETSVERYRAEHSLFGSLPSGDTTARTLSGQQLSELATQLASARADKSSADARARLLRQQLQSGRPVEAADVTNSPLIQGLVGEAVRLRSEIAELSSTLGPRHPRMLELSSQLGDLRSQIRDEIAKIVRSLEADAVVAAERERDLLSELEGLKVQSAEANSREVELRALEREAKAQRDLLESMLARYREASTRDTLQSLPADARIISRAAPASDPYFPKPAVTLIAVTVATLVLAVGAILAIELVRLAGLEHAGPGGPASPGGRGRRSDHGVVALRPERVGTSSSGVAAAGHGNLTALCDLVAGDGSGLPRLVLVAGTGAPDDEAAFAMSLARGVSARGFRVVLLDTGFGLGRFANVIGGDRPGLRELVDGERAFGEVLFRDPRSRAHVLPAGRGLAPQVDAARRGTDLVLGALADTYDIVLMLHPAGAALPEFSEKAPDAALLVVSAAQPQENVGALRDRILKTGLEAVTVVSLSPTTDAGGEGDALAA